MSCRQYGLKREGDSLFSRGQDLGRELRAAMFPVTETGVLQSCREAQGGTADIHKSLLPGCLYMFVAYNEFWNKLLHDLDSINL